MKVPDLIASLREGAGSKLTPEERTEIMQKLLDAEHNTEEVVLDQQKLDAHISTTTKGLFKNDKSQTYIPETPADGAQQSKNASSWFGKLQQFFRGSKASTETNPDKRKSFVENKTAIYAVVGGVLVFLAWQGTNFFLDSGHQQFDSKSKVAKAKTGKARTAARKTKSKPAVATATSNKGTLSIAQALSTTSIERALQDCTVPAATRTALSKSPEKTKDYESRDYTLVVLAIQSFQRKYHVANIIEKMETSSTKNNVARRLLSPEMSNLQTQIGQYRELRINMQKELTGLREQERKSQDGRRLQNRVVAGVNQGIRIRNEIELIEAHLRDGPTEEDLMMVEGQFSILKSMIENENSTAALLPDNTAYDMKEVKSLTNLDPNQLQQKLSQIIKNNFGAITAAVAKNSPDLKDYQIQNATKAISLLIGVLTVLKSVPENILAKLEREQLRVNNKLDRLLGTSSGHWLDYGPCLKGGVTVSKSN